MARNVKKKNQEPQLCQPEVIFGALKALEEERGIPVDYMVERIKQALVNAYRKDREDHKEIPAETVVVELTETRMSMVQQKTVVEEVENPAAQISLDAARNYNRAARVDDVVSIPVKVEAFGRIAAQTAKQVIIQGIREAERGAVYDSYSSKSQELLTGTVLRIDPVNHDMFVRVGMGNEQSDAILRAGEQIPGEVYHEGDMIRVYVVDVHRSPRGPQVAVSRTHPNLVRRLFELEVPEIAEGLVEIRNIAREPGSRTKIAVRGTQEGVDPVGACVGPRGGRVGAVVTELHGEKMDIITWSEDPCQYVAAALSPADVISVEQIPGQKACRVVVPDDQLSLAIGKEGQNARLAARLTSYKIDIKSASHVPAPEAPEAPAGEPEEA
ncbi:MAG: transcription termination factor NusA [Candidatus Faecousia sp.]|nr:transcription termination factor NusA [Clostridiales bacterium]MDY4219739.1 transcription termination factor NusA [Candidatus Faecousia sp.]